MSAGNQQRKGKWFICITQDVKNTLNKLGKIIQPIKIGTS